MDSSSHPSLYPSDVLPAVSKRKKDKKTYCVRLARMLEYLDRRAQAWDQKSPLLQLPAELRQTILGYVLDEQTIYDPRPSQQTQALALVCRTLADDLEPTMKQWDQDEAVLRTRFGTERNAMSAYIQELMMPIGVAAKAIPPRKSKKRHRKEADNAIASVRSGLRLAVQQHFRFDSATVA
ncbi:unnamed protein product [Zymoseptoria tritici ST99CH_1E4]|uniref:Uncharacterized protein n=1 Tax=Zymoseptoria tritici ST99CH_1E4 TaxID=1276532 RepID=A0A2H1GZP5_ZYMTR|nr:unnamed protein product [Zymoseptoria tritici ST99CH_1E4]